MALPGLHRRSAVAIACLLLIGSVAGCGSSSADSTASATTNREARLSFTIPAGWHRVRLIALPGAEVPLEISSFRVRGAVTTICDPHRIVSQIPTGGALLQILQDSGVKRHGAGAVSQASDVSHYPLLRKPFRLGAPHSHECGEVYNLWFRTAGRVFQLRVWSAPHGLSPRARAQIEQLMDSVRAR